MAERYVFLMFIALVLTTAAAAVGGCAGLAAGGAAASGPYVYTDGQVRHDYSSGLDETWSAALNAAEGLGMRIASREEKGSQAKIKAMDGNTEVWIHLDALGDNTTRVTVRYGVIGDRTASEYIQKAIARRL